MSSMKFIRILAFFMLLGSIRHTIWAQQVNSLYFIENLPVRHFLNPAFQPQNEFYVSIPFMGFSQFSIGNNSVALKDVIYNQNGQTITFLNPQGNVARFYSLLKNTTVARADFQIDLLSAGFRKKDNYWTFSLSEKINGMVSVPKDLFELAFFGTPDIQANSFNFTTLQTDISIYTEAALGLSRKLDDQWIVGGKLKFLYGSANFSNTNNQMKLQAGIGEWRLNGSGSVNFASPVQVNIGPDFQSFSYEMPTTAMGWLKPTGLGAAIDLGAEYQLNQSLRLSAAILDLGFIGWTQNVHNDLYNANYSFDGILQLNSNSGINTLQDAYNRFIAIQLADSVVRAFKSSSSSELTTKSYLTGISSRLNLGAEYIFQNNKLSLGLLSSSVFFKQNVNEEVTASVNFRPYHWLNGTVSYSVFNGRLGSIGAGLGLKTGLVHWFVAADYIPFQKVTLALSDFGINSPAKIPVPYPTSTFNFSGGVNLVLDKLINNARSTQMGLRKSNTKSSGNSQFWTNFKNIFKIPLGKKSKGLNPKKPEQDCRCDWK